MKSGWRRGEKAAAVHKHKLRKMTGAWCVRSNLVGITHYQKTSAKDISTVTLFSFGWDILFENKAEEN